MYNMRFIIALGLMSVPAMEGVYATGGILF